MTTVKIKIENDYDDDHHSERTVEIAAPGRDINEWFEDVVYEHTGDGHGIDTDLGACYTATVVEADEPTLVGRTYEWIS